MMNKRGFLGTARVVFVTAHGAMEQCVQPTEAQEAWFHLRRGVFVPFGPNLFQGEAGEIPSFIWVSSP